MCYISQLQLEHFAMVMLLFGLQMHFKTIRFRLILILVTQKNGLSASS